MLYVWISLFSVFLFKIDNVSSVVYSCNRNADCGCSRTNAILNKIVGGESAVDSSWAWAASLQYSRKGHFCGGTIISALYILTAAHCIANPSDIIQNAKIIVGINQLSELSVSTAQQRSIVRVISHPQYNSNTKINDIAILQLNQPLVISNGQGTLRLCLPHVIPANTSTNYPTPSSSLVAIGWGVLKSGLTYIPSNQHLQQVSLTAIPSDHRMCRSVLHNCQLQFCAGVFDGGKDTCQGDSGGALMQYDATKRQWILVGITSYGAGCGDPNYAGVYTRVSVYRNWIQSIITNGFVEVSVNGTSDTTINSPQSISLLYHFFTILLYVFIWS
ncbi:hypothetical protein I4U23_014786 [Adineta vaga]|nr:hypothetical protein I4U23_014786 [Adineta vaga]